MSKTEQSDFEGRIPIRDEEDEAALAAIDEGLHDAKAGRTVSLTEVRKLLSKWTARKAPRT